MQSSWDNWRSSPSAHKCKPNHRIRFWWITLQTLIWQLCLTVTLKKTKIPAISSPRTGKKHLWAMLKSPLLPGHFPIAAISPLEYSASSIFGKSIFGLNTGLSEHRSRGLRAHYKNGNKKSALNFVKNYVSWPCCHKDQMTNSIIVWWCHLQK